MITDFVKEKSETSNERGADIKKGWVPLGKQGISDRLLTMFVLIMQLNQGAK